MIVKVSMDVLLQPVRGGEKGREREGERGHESLHIHKLHVTIHISVVQYF